MKDIASIIFIITLVLWTGLIPMTSAIARPNFEKNGETIPAQPETHKKKVYVDPEGEFIYWPMDMRFYVRLAPSPDQDSPSYLLKNVQMGKGATTTGKLKKGIKLEINGRQFIRWYNALTDKTSFLKFFSDGEPPVATIALTGAPTCQHPKKGVFYGKGLVWTITAKDNVSGVETIYYSIDGEEFKDYSQALNLDQEKPYWLRYYSVDNVGYASVPGQRRFTVDFTPPVSKRHVDTRFIGDVFSIDTTIHLTSQDSGAGVKEIFYYLDDTAKPSIYANTKIKVGHLPDGEHKVTFYADDNVLNREKPNVYSFYLDRTPPVSKSRFVGDHHNDGKTDFISKRSRVELSSGDNKIGVDTIHFSFNKDKDDAYKLYKEPFLVPLSPGKQVVYFRALDRLKNLETGVPLPIHMDHAPPNSTNTITGIKFQQRDITWMTSKTVVSLAAKDDAAGVKEIQYQLGEGTPYIKYSEAITIPREGNYLFKYYSVDNVNNKEDEHPYLFIVDNTPPKVMTTFSVPPSRTVKDEDGKEINVYPRFTSLFLGAVDNSAGIAFIRYTINKDKEQEYRIALVFKEPGDYTMKLRVRDNVENSASESFRFRIEK